MLTRAARAKLRLRLRRSFKREAVLTMRLAQQHIIDGLEIMRDLEKTGGAHLTNDAAASVGPHHADLEDCRRILLASASRIDVGGGKPYRFASLDDCDSTTLQIVMMYCASSPSAQMNQIGVSNRRFNIAWRRMHRGVLREWIEIMQCHLGPHILISDLEDILCLK